MYHILEELEDIVKEELRKIIGKGNMTPLELDNSTKAICLLEKIKDLKDSYDMEGYSRRRSYENRRYSSDMYPRYENRDSYARRSMDNYDDRRYSGHDITEKMVARLEEIRMDANNDHERSIVDEWISRISDK